MIGRKRELARRMDGTGLVRDRNEDVLVAAAKLANAAEEFLTYGQWRNGPHALALRKVLREFKDAVAKAG